MNQQQQALSKLLGGAVDTGDSDSLQLPQIEEQRQTIANKRHDRESLVQQRNQLQVRLQQLEVQKDRLTLRAPEDGKVLKLLAKQGEIVQAVVQIGDPAQNIVQYSEEHPTDLIIIGNRGLSGLKKILLGSVSNYVLLRSQVPILIMK